MKNVTCTTDSNYVTTATANGETVAATEWTRGDTPQSVWTVFVTTDPEYGWVEEIDVAVLARVPGVTSEAVVKAVAYEALRAGYDVDDLKAARKTFRLQRWIGFNEVWRV
jgi:hypothetical protein